MTLGDLKRAVAVAAALCLLTGCRARATLASDPAVEALLARMTLDDKIAMLHGTPEPLSTYEGQAGYLPGIPRLGIGAMRFADGPPGVLTRYPATALTGSLGLAATFSAADARANGTVIAGDARAAGIDVVLEPFINIDRDPTFYRAYNTFGEDPLLTGTIGAAQIDGIQAGGVMAMAKHYVGYDGSADASIDQQTLHEIYVAPFAAAVRAGVASIMCGYSVINDHYGCGNHHTLTTILRQELGFQGFVTSDWGAMHGTLFINAGLDVEMPGSGSTIASYLAGSPPIIDHPDIELAPPVINTTPEETPTAPVLVPTMPGTLPVGLKTALQRGEVSESTITEAARRVLRQMLRFGHVATGPAAVAAPAVDSEAVVRKTSIDAAVLLKNDADALPLTPEDLRALAMIGPGALQDIAAGISGEKGLGHVSQQIGPSAALREALAEGGRDGNGDAGGGAVRIIDAAGDDMTGLPVPASQLAAGPGGGLEREDMTGRHLGTDAMLDFTSLRGNALPPGSSAQWSGELMVPESGRYRLYLQILGAQGSLVIDGRNIASTGYLSLHGDVLQAGQDNVLPTRDGLDNVRRELELSAGPHTLLVKAYGEPRGAPVQVRLAWVTPEQRLTDYQRAVKAAAGARKAVVFAWSRGQPVLRLPGDQDQLISDVAAVNPNTIVVLNVAEPIAMPWLDRVRAVLLMWYPGDEGGRAAADLLLGRANPAGRLPFTWPRRVQDGPANDPSHPERTSEGIEGHTSYSEGLFVGYRWYDKQRLEPLFPFGFGGSYTHFEYRDLSLTRTSDGGLEASFELINSGDRDGDEVPQLYLGPPDPAPRGAQFALRSLAAFDRVSLRAGEHRRVVLKAAPRALQYWSVRERRWLTATGAHSVYVGASSRDLRLQGSTTIQ
jgi:beta-glucosidase